MSSEPEGWLEGDPGQLPERDEADVYEALSIRRRRMVVLLLSRTEGPVGIGPLSEVIASAEEGRPPRTIGSEKRKAVYVGLYQAHSEKLAEAGLIEFQQRSKTLVPTELTYRVGDWLAESLATDNPAELDALNAAMDAVGYGRWNVDVPTQIELFRVPTGEQFRDLREAAGVTQTQIADVLGVSSGTLSNFERGDTSIRAETLRDAVEYVRRNGGGRA